MNHTNYIKNLFNSFIQDSGRIGERVMFIKHYNTFNLNLEEIEEQVGQRFRDGLLYHRYSKNDIKEPYEPFMSGIRYYYQKFFSKEISVEEFIEKCNVYSLHKEIFISYLKNGIATRKEAIIYAEILYEREMFINSIINCLDYIARKKDVLIVLNRFHLAGLSTIHLVKQIISKIDKCAIRLLLIYNETHSTYLYTEDEFYRLIDKAEESNILFEWDGIEDNGADDYHSSFIPNSRFFTDYLSKLCNLYYMLAIEDAEYYMEIIYHRIVQEKLSVDKQDKFNFFAIRALNDIQDNNTNGALLMCEKLLSMIKSEDTYLNFVYYYIISLAQMTMIQSELAIKYSQKCLELAKNMEKDNLIFLSEVLCVGAQFSGWKDVFSVEFSVVKIEEYLVERFKKYGFKNTLAYYLAYGCENNYIEIEDIISGKAEPVYFNEAIKIGTELKNNNFFLSAYTKSIIIYTDKGFHKFVDEFYQEKLKIIEHENNTKRQANLLMGMGYNAIISEQFAKASDYINKSINILYELKNSENIAEGLYNMSINCICCQDYEDAAIYLENVFKMLDNLGFETITICNASKLYGLLALCYFKIKNEYRCYLCLDKIEVLLSHIFEENSFLDFNQWREDLFLYYFVSGLVSKNNGDYDEAYNLFIKAKEHFELFPGAKFYNIVEFTIEFVSLCRLLDKNSEAENLLNESMKFCEDNGYIYKSKVIMFAVSGKRYSQKQFNLSMNMLNLERLVDLAYNTGKEFQLRDRKKDINFLSAWQEMLNREEFEDTVLINNAMSTLQNNFNLDGILIIKKNNLKVNSLYEMSGYSFNNNDYQSMFEFFETSKRAFITSRTDKSFMEYEKIVAMFGKNKIVTLVGIPLANETGIYTVLIATVNMHKNFRRNRILLNEENLVIMKTAFVQLTNDLERIHNRKNIVEMNKKLKELAVTDMLTGLYNRQGLSKMIEDNCGCNSSITILYADLDNFKFYNDSFGHDVGDLILVEFAKVFKRVSKSHGYAVRYGGDEFLVVLRNVDREKGIQVAKEIYKEISGGFVDVVKNYTNKNINIPKEKQVSCSIGIASSEYCDHDIISDTLKRADEALYYMKKNKKGSYILWEDIEKS